MTTRKLTERITAERTEAQYRRRSGPPLPGCDCMQCFGYCIVNADIRDREIRLRHDEAMELRRNGGLAFVGDASAFEGYDL